MVKMSAPVYHAFLGVPYYLKTFLEQENTCLKLNSLAFSTNNPNLVGFFPEKKISNRCVKRCIQFSLSEPTQCAW